MGTKDDPDWSDSYDSVNCHNSGRSVLSFLIQTVVSDAYDHDDDSSDRRGKTGL